MPSTLTLVAGLAVDDAWGMEATGTTGMDGGEAPMLETDIFVPSGYFLALLVDPQDGTTRQTL